MLRDKFESVIYAPKVNAPTLIIAAEHDEVVPQASTERLLARFRHGVATVTILPGTSHNTVSASPAYIPLVAGR
jgi:pimeloyl-ACP methyl ester carboxylesterase